MARRIRVVSDQDYATMAGIAHNIRADARRLHALGAKRAAAKLRVALKSVDGAVRHAYRCAVSPVDR